MKPSFSGCVLYGTVFASRVALSIFSMNPRLLLLLPLFFIPAAFAAKPTVPTPAQLETLLAQYPAADTDGDGELTLSEALAYVKKRKASAGDSASKKQRVTPDFADVSYGPDPRNIFDLWLAPKSDKPAPLIVQIHGGGFIGGSKESIDPDMIRHCRAAGVSIMAIQYRLRPHAPINDILRDSARALQFVRYHASEYNIDPTRIACYGGSAGAGTSVWLALHSDLADPANPDPVLRESSRIVAAAGTNVQATYDLLRWESYLGPYDPAWGKGDEKDTLEFYHVASMAELNSERGRALRADVDMAGLATSDDPPLFLFCSQPDGPVQNHGHFLHHPNHTLLLQKSCEAAGIPTTVWFAQLEPKIQGDQHAALREFLFGHLGVKSQ